MLKWQIKNGFESEDQLLSRFEEVTFFVWGLEGQECREGIFIIFFKRIESHKEQ